MYDIVLVRVIQRLRDRANDREDLFQRYTAIIAAILFSPIGKRSAVRILHYKDSAPLGTGQHREDPADICLMQVFRQIEDFSDRLHLLLVVAQFFVNELADDLLTHVFAIHLLRKPRLPHSAIAKTTDKTVIPDQSAFAQFLKLLWIVIDLLLRKCIK